MSGYVLSRDADADLQNIFSYGYGACGEKQATAYLYELYETLGRIGANPGIGRARADLHPLVRGLSHRSHTVFFLPWRGTTLVTRILHGAADHLKAFEGYDPPAGMAD